jgi:hypothetical protein
MIQSEFMEESSTAVIETMIYVDGLTAHHPAFGKF